jgi:hypothetical protein
MAGSRRSGCCSRQSLPQRCGWPAQRLYPTTRRPPSPAAGPRVPAAGREWSLLNQVAGRELELRPDRHPSDADLLRRARGSAWISVWGVAGQPQRAIDAGRDRIRQPHLAHRLRAISQEVDSARWPSATATAGLGTRTGLDCPAAHSTDELVARPVWRQATDCHHLAGARPQPLRPLAGRWQPKTVRPGQGRHLHGITLPHGFSSADATPALLSHLPATVHAGFVAGYAESIQSVFLVAVPDRRACLPGHLADPAGGTPAVDRSRAGCGPTGPDGGGLRPAPPRPADPTPVLK